MEDLLKKQIHDNCRLSFPEGLKDLMADITREVLRYQPGQIYQFISDYLAAMLVTRENLKVGANLCSDVCTASCNPELEDEFRFMGFDNEETQTAIEIIQKHFDHDTVQESSLLQELYRKIEDLPVDKLPEIQNAIIRAFVRNKVNNTVVYESSSEEEGTDEVMQAARHTLRVYRRTKHPEQLQHSMAKRIQAAYRAYGVRRLMCTEAVNVENIAQEQKSDDLDQVKLTYYNDDSKVSSMSLDGSFFAQQHIKNEVVNLDTEFHEVQAVEDVNLNKDTNKKSGENIDLEVKQSRKNSISFDLNNETEKHSKKSSCVSFSIETGNDNESEVIEEEINEELELDEVWEESVIENEEFEDEINEDDSHDELIS